MKNLRLANIIDTLFINLLIFLITFTWLKFFNRNILLSFILSLFILTIYNVVKLFFSTKKKNKIKMNSSLEKDIEMYMYTLLSNSKNENLDLFNKVFSKNNCIIDKEKNLIRYSKKDKIINVFPMFNSKILNFEDCLKKISFSKKNNTNIVLFLCYSSNSKEKIFLEQICDIEVKIYEKKEIFNNLFRKSQIYPKFNITIKENKKIKFKQLFEISFNKSRAKGYFLSGIFIFFCSFIVRYNIYYVFMSSLLFFFTLLSLLKKENTNIKDFSLLD